MSQFIQRQKRVKYSEIIFSTVALVYVFDSQFDFVFQSHQVLGEPTESDSWFENNKTVKK